MIKNWLTNTDYLNQKEFNPNQGVSTRLAALDLARCLAMFFMTQGHVIYAIADSSFIDPANPYYNVWSFIRGITAPIFLTVSGAVQVFANKRDEETGRVKPKHIYRRLSTAFLLIFTGYLLVFPAQKLFHLFFINEQDWTRFFQVNILHVIGVSILLLLAVFLTVKKDKIFIYITFSIGMLIFLLTPIVYSMNMYEYLPMPFAQYFSLERSSLFTLFPYTGYMFIGAAYGTLIKMQQPENRLNFILKTGIAVGAVLIVISFPVTEFIKSQNFDFIDPMKGNFGFSLLRQGLVFIFISIVVVVYRYTKALSGWYSLFGKRALFVYIIHLTILYGTPWTGSFGQLLHRQVPIELSIPIAIFVVALSGFFAWLYDYLTRKNSDNVLLFRYSLIFLIAFLLLV